MFLVVVVELGHPVFDAVHVRGDKVVRFFQALTLSMTLICSAPTE